MARVTVEDCLVHIPNRFNLVMVAAKRARQLERGGVESRVPRQNDKCTVLALREIASGQTSFDASPDLGIKVRLSTDKPLVVKEIIEADSESESESTESEKE